MFSLYLSSKGDDVEDAIHSNLILGGYDLEKYSWETELTYLNISNTSGYWQVPLTAIHLDTGLDIEAKSVTFDIGTSEILASFLDHSTIKNAFRFYPGCAEDANNYIYCECPFQNFTKSYPDLSFFLGAEGVEFRVSPYHYFYWNETTELCLLLIGENTGENWVLGDVFLREYYSVWNMDDSTIGLARAKLDNYPKQKSSGEGMSLTAVIMIVGGAAILGMIVAAVLYKLTKNQLRKKKKVLLSTVSVHSSEVLHYNDQSSSNPSLVESFNEFSSDSILNEPLVEIKPDYIVVPANLSQYAKN